MTVQDRKEKAILHKELVDLLTNCPNDMAFLKRLIFAQEIIANEIKQFSNDEYMNAIMTFNKGQSNLTFGRPPSQMHLTIFKIFKIKIQKIN